MLFGNGQPLELLLQPWARHDRITIQVVSRALTKLGKYEDGHKHIPDECPFPELALHTTWLHRICGKQDVP